jgi:hypothetical protein
VDLSIIIQHGSFFGLIFEDFASLQSGIQKACKPAPRYLKQHNRPWHTLGAVFYWGQSTSPCGFSPLPPPKGGKPLRARGLKGIYLFAETVLWR